MIKLKIIYIITNIVFHCNNIRKKKHTHTHSDVLTELLIVENCARRAAGKTRNVKIFKKRGELRGCIAAGRKKRARALIVISLEN